MSGFHRWYEKWDERSANVACVDTTLDPSAELGAYLEIKVSLDLASSHRIVSLAVETLEVFAGGTDTSSHRTTLILTVRLRAHIMLITASTRIRGASGPPQSDSRPFSAKYKPSQCGDRVKTSESDVYTLQCVDRLQTSESDVCRGSTLDVRIWRM